VGSIAQYLNPALWGDSLQASINGLGYTAFWIALLQIVLINLLLSGDNAVIIAMACRGLPPRQRLWGMIIGASGAVLLRVVFTVLFARLMVLPYVNLIGGLALLYIAAKLLVPADRGKEQIKAAANLWRAVRTVAVADVIMSLDNTIAIVVAARGNLALLVIGLVLSIPIILAGAALIMALLDRFPIFVWAGAALLGWIAGDIIATDPAVSGYLTAELGEKVAQQMQIASAAAGAVLVIAMGGFLRRRGKSKSRTKAAK
jgi:YjbE family integral membrane protein